MLIGSVLHHNQGGGQSGPGTMKPNDQCPCHMSFVNFIFKGACFSGKLHSLLSVPSAAGSRIIRFELVFNQKDNTYEKCAILPPPCNYTACKLDEVK